MKDVVIAVSKVDQIHHRHANLGERNVIVVHPNRLLEEMGLISKVRSRPQNQVGQPRRRVAVALNVERGWGEEFTSNLLQLFEIDSAYSLPPSVHAPAFLEIDGRPTQINIFGWLVTKIFRRKKRARSRRTQDPPRNP